MIFTVFLTELAVGVLAGDFVATIFGGAGKLGIALSDDDDLLLLVRAGAMDSGKWDRRSTDVLDKP